MDVQISSKCETKVDIVSLSGNYYHMQEFGVFPNSVQTYRVFTKLYCFFQGQIIFPVKDDSCC